jgi:hypothetical protein
MAKSKMSQRQLKGKDQEKHRSKRNRVGSTERGKNNNK